MLRREVMKMAGSLFGLGAGTPSRFPYPGRPQPSPGISPSPGIVVRANRVIVFGPTGSPVGVFVYTPGTTPGLGNLPVEWMTESSTDPFGNVLPSKGAGTQASGAWAALAAGQLRLQDSVSTVFGVVRAPAGTGGGLLDVISPARSSDVAAALNFLSKLASGQGSPLAKFNGSWQLPGILSYAPSGDATGATDVTVINNALAAGLTVQLLPGTYYVNAPVKFPAHGLMRGAGRDVITGLGGTTIQAVGSIGAVIASSNWVTNAGTGQNGGQLRDLQVNGNGTAVNGIVFQTEDALIENVQVLNCTTNGIAFSVLCANGTTAISGNLSNNQVNRCVVTGCPGRGIATLEHAGSDVFTDGFITWCVVNNCGFGIGLDQAADWQIVGNHIYTIAFDGFYLGDCFNTHVHHNEIDQWGGFAGAAINARGINAVSVSSFGGVSVFTDNVVWMGSAPGNAGTVIEGINFGCQPAVTTCLTAIGNQAWMQPAAGFASATPFIATNAAATSVMNLQTTGNFAFGHWGTPNWTLTTAGGTITHTTGV